MTQPGYEGYAKLGNMLGGGVKRDSEKAYVDQLNKNYTAYGNLEQARKERAQAMIAQGQVDARSTLQDRINAQYTAHGLKPEDAGVAGAFALSDSTPNFNLHMGGTEKVTDMAVDEQIQEALTKGDLKRARILSAVKTDKVLPVSKGGEVFDPINATSTVTPLGSATIAEKGSRVTANNARASASEASARRADRKSKLSEIDAKIKDIETARGKPLSSSQRIDLMDQFLETGKFNFADGPAKAEKMKAGDATMTLPKMGGETPMQMLKRQATEAIEAGGDKDKILARLRQEIIRRKLTE